MAALPTRVGLGKGAKPPLIFKTDAETTPEPGRLKRRRITFLMAVTYKPKLNQLKKAF
jgi:hypothetical protein